MTKMSQSAREKLDSYCKNIFISFGTQPLNNILLLSESSDARKYAGDRILGLLNSKLKERRFFPKFTEVGPIQVNSAKNRT